MELRSQIVGCGAYLPERIVTNDELAARLDTSDEWIRQRTGIGERRVAAAGELTSDLAVRAARAGARRRRHERQRSRSDRSGDRDPGQHLPGDRDQGAGAARHAPRRRPSTSRRCAPALSLRSPSPTMRCALGQARTALVIGAETFSRILDWDDRGTCVLFGDGAGALVLKAVPEPGPRGAPYPLDPSAFRRAPVRHPLCRWRPVVDRPYRLSADGGARGVPPGGAAPERGGRRGARRQRADRGGHRLAGAASGQQPDHRRDRAQARALRPTRWSSRSSATPTPRPPRSRWPWRRRWPMGGSSPASWC